MHKQNIEEPTPAVDVIALTNLGKHCEVLTI